MSDSGDSSSKEKSNSGLHLTLDQPALKAFAEDVAFLWCPPRSRVSCIPVLDKPPTPLEFCQKFVQPNRPCIIRNAILADDGISPLFVTLDDISKHVSPTRKLTVDVTPDGQGDCIRTVQTNQQNEFSKAAVKEMFVQPKEVEMTFEDFVTKLQSPKLKSSDLATENEIELDLNQRKIIYSKGTSLCSNKSTKIEPDDDKSSTDIPLDSVVYYSRQNDCLRQEVPELQTIFPPTIHWAQEAFQTDLDAVNIWIGNEEAISSMHKDHYENMFYVASGEKVFTICPPSDVAFLYENQEYSRGIFEVANRSENSDNNNPISSWCVQGISDEEVVDGELPEASRVRWIAPDVSQLLESYSSEENRQKLLQKYPLLEHTHPMEVRVKAGELLYLPSLWFHRVTQSCETVGVNYWYDMKFDSPLWCYFSLMQKMTSNQQEKP